MENLLEVDSTDYHILSNAVKKISMVDGLICEIGLRKGGSLKIIIDSLIQNFDYHRNIISIDPFGNIPYECSDSGFVKLDYTNSMRDQTISAIYSYVLNKPVNLVYFCMEDTEFFSKFFDGVPIYLEEKTLINEYSLVFFDGPHSSEHIQKEISFFQDRTTSGSVYVFDDISGYAHDEKIENFLFKNKWVLLEKSINKASYIKI